MISHDDVRRILQRPATSSPVLSVFLDMAVTSDNKRTYHLQLNRWRSQFPELSSDRPGHHRDALGAAFGAVERWITDNFDPSNKGVAVFAEVGGAWTEGVQVPASLENRMEIRDEPVVGPLIQLLRSERHHGIVLVDREHLRMISARFGRPVEEHEVQTEPYPAAHDVRRGGYSAPDYQRRKAEETRHFFKEFALEVGEFMRRYRPDDLVILGTEDNVKNFLDFLTPPVRDAVVYTGSSPIDATAAEVLQRLDPVYAELRDRELAEAVELLRDRVLHGHKSVAGYPATLQHLQQGKVDALVLARGAERTGSRCLRCAFYLADSDSSCPYCGGETRGGVDIVEAILRLVEEQDLALHVVPADALADVDGVGALLRY